MARSEAQSRLYCHQNKMAKSEDFTVTKIKRKLRAGFTVTKIKWQDRKHRADFTVTKIKRKHRADFTVTKIKRKHRAGFTVTKIKWQDRKHRAGFTITKIKWKHRAGFTVTKIKWQDRKHRAGFPVTKIKCQDRKHRAGPKYNGSIKKLKRYTVYQNGKTLQLHTNKGVFYLQCSKTWLQHVVEKTLSRFFPKLLRGNFSKRFVTSQKTSKRIQPIFRTVLAVKNDG